jgi:flagellar motility protein MotE (MotC chaperone)
MDSECLVAMMERFEAKVLAKMDARQAKVEVNRK